MTCESLTHGPHNPECTCPLAVKKWLESMSDPRRYIRRPSIWSQLSDRSVINQSSPVNPWELGRPRYDSSSDLADSKYDIEILPPTRWQMFKRKVRLYLPHWFRLIVDPTYRMIWRMANAKG